MQTSIYPADFFGSKTSARMMGYCFVLMPFKEEMREVYEIVRDALEAPPWNFTCRRADDFMRGGHILTTVLQGIAESEIIIADLTGLNGNVLYELGIAHMAKRPEEMLLLTQDLRSIPFDLQSFRAIEYTQSIQGGRKLQENLHRALKEITKPVHPFVLKTGETYRFPEKLMGEDLCLYDFSVFGDYLGAGGIKVTLELRRYRAGHPEPEILGPYYEGISPGASVKIPHMAWELRLNQTGEGSAGLNIVRFALALSDRVERLSGRLVYLLRHIEAIGAYRHETFFAEALAFFRCENEQQSGVRFADGHAGWAKASVYACRLLADLDLIEYSKTSGEVLIRKSGREILDDTSVRERFRNAFDTPLHMPSARASS